VIPSDRSVLNQLDIQLERQPTLTIDERRDDNASNRIHFLRLARPSAMAPTHILMRQLISAIAQHH